MIFLLVEKFDSVTIAISFSIAAVLTAYISTISLNFESKGSKKESRAFNLLSILFVVGWLGFNMFYTSQNIFKYRDPAVYNLTAKWLIDHDNLRIPVDTTLSEGTTEGFVNQSPAFHPINEEGNRLYAQGLHLLPAYSSVLGRATNDYRAFKVNVFLASVALLTLFAFFRLFMAPKYAFLGMACLSFSLPFLYFSRDMYTEPLLVAFLFGSMTALYHAMKNRHNVYWILSGLLLGSTAMVRIDSYLSFFGIFFAIGLYVALLQKRKRKGITKQVSLFLLSCAAACVVGWLDLTVLSKYHYVTLNGRLDISNLFIGVLLLIATMTAVVWVSWKTNIMNTLKKAFLRISLSSAMILLAAVMGLVFIMSVYRIDSEIYAIREIAAFQSPIEIKGLNYVSYSSVILWIIWYMGIPIALLSLFGLFKFVKQVLRDKTMLGLPAACVFISVSFFYIYDPHITPDHVWASRRLLTIIFPGVIFFAMISVELIMSLPVRKKISNIIKITLPAIVIIPILTTSSFYLFERTHQGSLTQIKELCSILPENSSVLLAGSLSLVGKQAVTTYCNTQTHGYNGILSTEAYIDFYKFAEGQGKVPVVAFYFKEHGVTTVNSYATRLKTYELKDIHKNIKKAPEMMYAGQQQITVGILKSNGDLKPLNE